MVGVASSGLGLDAPPPPPKFQCCCLARGESAFFFDLAPPRRVEYILHCIIANHMQYIQGNIEIRGSGGSTPFGMATLSLFGNIESSKWMQYLFHPPLNQHVSLCCRCLCCRDCFVVAIVVLVVVGVDVFGGVGGVVVCMVVVVVDVACPLLKQHVS